MNPIANAPATVTYPAAGVMPTKPHNAPVQSPIILVLSLRNISKNIQTTNEVPVATVVVRNA